MRNAWPMLKDNIRGMDLYWEANDNNSLSRLRRLSPTLLNDCSSLRALMAGDNDFPAFPPDDSANATDGQAMAKWLCSPRPDGVPKVLSCAVPVEWQSKMEQFTTVISPC